MKDIATDMPPAIHWQDDELCVFLTFVGEDGEAYRVRASAGDGRYLAARLWALVIAPAIGIRPLDRQ